jgi:hypothetical protein
LAYCTDLTGVFGAQNTVTTLNADGRFGSVALIDGDVALPTAQDLRDNFQCVIAMSDNRCGFNAPALASGANALAGFASTGGGVVLATFGFSGPGGIGFGPAIFAAGLSPFQQAGISNAAAGGITIPPAVGDGIPVCDRMLAGVGSTSSSFANFVNLSAGAVLCENYDNGRHVLAINAGGNVVGLNTFPASQSNNTDPDYRQLVSNSVFEVCGPLIVDIDIKPGSDPNSINCNNPPGVIAVAILTTDDFDATTVDHTTVTFEGAGETHIDKNTGLPRRHEEDVDGDGDIDLVFHFRLGDTGLDCASTEGTLSGETFDGQAIEGTDAVRMIDVP